MNDLLEYEKRRRIMRAVRFDEISGVDRPAQQGALAVMIKNSKATPDTPKDFDAAVALMRERDPKLSRTEAMQAARRRWPSLLAKHNDDAIAAAAIVAESEKQARAEQSVPPEVQDFERRVDDELAKAAGAGRPIKRVDALGRVAKAMSPAEFERYSRVVVE